MLCEEYMGQNLAQSQHIIISDDVILTFFGAEATSYLSRPVFDVDLIWKDTDQPELPGFSW